MASRSFLSLAFLCSLVGISLAVANPPVGYSLYSSGYTVSASSWTNGGTIKTVFQLSYPLPGSGNIWTYFRFSSSKVSVVGALWTSFSISGFGTQTADELTYQVPISWGVGSNGVYVEMNAQADHNINESDIVDASLYISTGATPSPTAAPTDAPTDAPTYWWSNLVPTAAPSPAPSVAVSTDAPTEQPTAAVVQDGGHSSTTTTNPVMSKQLILGLIYVVVIVFIGAAIIIYRECKKRKRRSQSRPSGPNSESSGLLSARNVANSGHA